MKRQAMGKSFYRPTSSGSELPSEAPQ